MGQLKTALSSLAGLADAIEKKGDTTLHELAAKATSVSQIGGRVAGGYELLYMYLKQRAVAQGARIDGWHGTALQEHMDSKVAEMIQQIETARSEMADSFKHYDDCANLMVKTMSADIDRAKVFSAEIAAQIAKKKKQWLTSPKYKSKIAGYETSVKDLNTKLNNLKVDVSSYRQMTASSSPRKIAALQVTAATTVDQVHKVAAIGLTQELDEMKNQSSGKRLAVLLKGYGKELAAIRSWATEADAMDAVS